MWIRLGNSKFDNLRESKGGFLTLPSRRTLQIEKSKLPVNGSGFQTEIFEALYKEIDSNVKSLSRSTTSADYDVILSWDATGYNQGLTFDSEGMLLGFDDDPERFNMHNVYNNCVNCFMVTSPQRDITITFPVAYYHTSGLNSMKIRRQVAEVMTGLDSVGLRVITLLCDGASEHARYFNLTLEEFAVADGSIKVRSGGMWAVSDPPHLVKKFRNNWLSSGERRRHTRRLDKGGHHIGWEVMRSVYNIATRLSNGDKRHFNILPKFTWDVVEPTTIKRLRVSLAAIPFSKNVRDFVSLNLDHIVEESGLRPGDVRVTLEYMGMVDEIFQIMNSEYPVTWTSTLDDEGNPIGLRDRVVANGVNTLSCYSKIYGVSVQYLAQLTPHVNNKPPCGSVFFIDRPKRLLTIAKYFSDWKQYVNDIPDLTKQERSKQVP